MSEDPSIIDNEFGRSLFEDSDDSEIVPKDTNRIEEVNHEEDIKVTAHGDEFEKVISNSLYCYSLPENHRHFVVCKLPPALSVEAAPFDEEREREFLRNNPQLLEHPLRYSDVFMLRWRFKPTDDDCLDEKDHRNVLETNAHLIEWDDKTFTLFVGETPLDVEPRREIVFLLEDTKPDIKPVHAVITERLQAKFSNILKNESVRKKYSNFKRQKTALTSISEAISSEMSSQKRLVVTRENERSRRLQQSSTRQPRGLTRNFLESEPESE